MQMKPEFRRGERFRHEYIIKLGEDLALSPKYAVAVNLSETGMYFKSLFEMVPGARIWIVIYDSISGQNQVSARVVWCRKLESSNVFSLRRRCRIPPGAYGSRLKSIRPGCSQNGDPGQGDGWGCDSNVESLSRVTSGTECTPDGWPATPTQEGTT